MEHHQEDAMRMTGSDGEDCPAPDGRALRLAAVLYAADARTGHAGLRQKVAELNDHKGTLGVTWEACPTFAEVVAVGTAWCEVGNECDSRHALADGRPLCDHDGDRWTFDRDAVGLMFEAEAGDVAVAEFLLTATPA